MQVQYGADIVVALLILTDDLFIVCLAQECKRNTVAAERRLDDIGNVMLVGLLIEVGQILAGCLLMATEVIIGASAMPHSSPQSVNGKAYSISVVARE